MLDMKIKFMKPYITDSQCREGFAIAKSLLQLLNI